MDQQLSGNSPIVQNNREHLHHLEGDMWLVPCVANYIENKFVPLYQPVGTHTSHEDLLRRQGWTEAEDEVLLKITNAHGPKAWSSIAKELNMLLYGGRPVRQGRQCRERWNNHVDPNLKKGEWSNEEDVYLLQRQREIGNKWSEISRGLPGRTENNVKNRWKSLMKKLKKECPKGFDPISFLLAEKKGTVIETNEGSTISIVSPIVTQRSLNQKPMMHTNYFSPRQNPVRSIHINTIRASLQTHDDYITTTQAIPNFTYSNGVSPNGSAQNTPSPSTFLRLPPY